ncbi:hypothetical protein ACFEMC_19220 [Kineococcus sp. DHX-1]|uniref:hypothetical protein n=1 Tax=Kineococcus sp. DHX-1 TaxID=3349638 RepID=UPI0036D38EBB
MNAVLSSHYFAKVTYLPKNEMTTAASTDLALRDAVVWYTKRVDENQGIKQNNLFSLLLPLGFNENDFDTVWLGSMNSFGSGRGDTAHGRPVANFGRRAIDISPRGSHSSSITVPVWTAKATKTRTTTTPWDVEKTLKDLVPEMKAWDDRLRNGI